MAVANSALAHPGSVLKTSNSAITQPGMLNVAPTQDIASYPVRFSATGSEYLRIWIVNLLLIVVTFGIYLPWAKVRKLKYFYNNTRIDEEPLDFHGEPKKMLRGTMIVGVFFLVYSKAAGFAPIAGLIAVLALLVLWPLLFRASMRFRLANTSWRGLRFRFVDSKLLEPYMCLVPPLALLLLPSTMLSFAASEPASKSAALPQGMGATMGLVFLLFLGLVPYFFWRLKRYQHNHYAWGPLKSEYRSGVGTMYGLFARTIAVVALLVLVFGGFAFALLPGVWGSGTKGGVGAMLSLLLALVPLLILFFISINIAPRAYFTARMQNLVWSRTGNRYFRFKSELMVWPYMRLQFKNYLLILITLGFYWPFAVVATKKMQLEAISLKSRIGLDALTDAARKRESDAAGDMAADLFGLDVGM